MQSIRRAVARLLGVDVDSIEAREQVLQGRIEKLRTSLKEAREANERKAGKLKSLNERVDFWKAKAAGRPANPQKIAVLNERIALLKNQLTEARAAAKRYAAQCDALKQERHAATQPSDDF
jgi:chromosome segregation ATPase